VFIRVNLWLKLSPVADEDEAAPVEGMVGFGVLQDFQGCLSQGFTFG
jgi:hypothetical protein